MIDEAVVRAYIPQWASSLKPGGRLVMTDHNPKGRDGRMILSGPRRPIEYRAYGLVPALMQVLPQETEVAMIVEGGFRVLEGPNAYPYFGGGYYAVYTPK